MACSPRISLSFSLSLCSFSSFSFPPNPIQLYSSPENHSADVPPVHQNVRSTFDYYIFLPAAFYFVKHFPAKYPFPISLPFIASLSLSLAASPRLPLASFGPHRPPSASLGPPRPPSPALLLPFSHRITLTITLGRYGTPSFLQAKDFVGSM